MARISQAVKADSQFQTLVAVLGNQTKAKAAYDRIKASEAPKVETKSELQQLLDAGFSQEEAEKALGAEVKAEPEAKPVSLAKPEETPKERLARQVDQAGLTFTKGRVYINKAILEGAARSLRNGKAQIVEASGNGRVSHVLVVKEESGDVSIQNLTGKKEA